MLSSWIYSVVCASIICALCSALTPDGRVKKASEIVLGIVMLIALVSPLKALDFQEYSVSLEKYKHDAEALTISGSEIKENLDRRIIEEKYAAYILDKAAESGVKPVSVTVSCAWSENHFWYPDTLEVVLGSEDDLQKCGAVRRSAECELGIEEARQIWRTG